MNPHLTRAHLLVQQERYDMAVDVLRQGLAASPDDARVHALLGMCLAEQEKFDEATVHVQQAVHLAPDDPYNFYTLASVMGDRRRWNEARQAIVQAIEIDPSDADHFAMLSRIELAQERWKDALDAAERGLAVDGEHAACINLRAMAQVKLGDRSGAAATIDQALARRPDDPYAHANRGWTLLHSGQPRQAMEHFREALRLKPDFEWAQQGIVEALKAHNFIYRWMLAWFLWMARLPAQARWGIIIGGYIGYQFLRQAAVRSPAFAPYIWPILAIYLVFAVMTWLVVPLSNLLLRLHPWGRHALSRDATRGANLVAVTLIVPPIFVGCAYALGFDLGYVILLLLLLLALPASAVYQCDPRWPRKVAIAVVWILAILGYGPVIVVMVFGNRPTPIFVLEIATLCTMLYVYGTIASQFLMLWLGRVRVQR